MTADSPVSYDPGSDMLWVELRPWPPEGDPTGIGGEDAEDDLVVHYAADGAPWAWEIEHASLRPDLVARAFAAVREARGLPKAA